MGGLRGVLEGSSRSEGVLERFEGAPGGPRGREGGVTDDPKGTPGAKLAKNVVRYALLKGSWRGPWEAKVRIALLC